MNKDIWKHKNNDTTIATMADLKFKKIYTLDLKDWELKTIIKVLCDSDDLVSNHLGLVLRRRMANLFSDNAKNALRQIKECDDALRVLHDSNEMEELKLKARSQNMMNKNMMNIRGDNNE
jgi:hypothetical protein